MSTNRSTFVFKLFTFLTVLAMLFTSVAPLTAFAAEETPENPTPEQSVEETAAVESEESEEETDSEEELAEIVQALSEAEAVLVNTEGEVIPLASEHAIAALTAPDPIGCPPGVTPATWGGSGAGCTISYSSIQDAIDDVLVTDGWTIYIDPGEFIENVQVTKSVTLQGSGQGATIIKPAASDVSVGCNPGTCPSVTNTVIWVLANGVSIFDLTVDGDNTSLTSGVVVGGADIDARNGILTNSHTDLTVQNVTVQNVYLRGIQIGAGNGTFDFSNNTVNNVQATSSSIGIFTFTSGGVIQNNTITNVGDGIALNWSTGTQVLNNKVSNASTGIHTDNAQGSDLISGNTVSNGKSNSYGIFVFAPYVPITVSNNTVSNVHYGLTLAGHGAGAPASQMVFDSNKVSAITVGAYVTSDVWWYFTSDVDVLFSNNTFTGGQYAFYLESQSSSDYLPGAYGPSHCAGADCVVQLTLICNTVSGQTVAQVLEATGDTFWDGNGGPNYNGVYIVDDSGNVCAVVAGDDPQSSPSKPLNEEALEEALQGWANNQFPLFLNEQGEYRFTCVLEEVLALPEGGYIYVGEEPVSSVGKCSYLAFGAKQTVVIALTYGSQLGDYQPGDIVQVSFAHWDESGLFANSGSPWDVANFLATLQVETIGHIDD